MHQVTGKRQRNHKGTQNSAFYELLYKRFGARDKNLYTGTKIH